MPNRRHYRGPRRPSPGAPEGTPPEGGVPPPPGFFAGAQGPGGEGARPPGRRRRRGRGGRGAGLGAIPPSLGAEGATQGSGALPEPRQPLDGGEEAHRRRRRRGRGGAGEPRPAESTTEFETREGELPADYIPLPVERGTAFLFEPRETALEVVDEEEEARAPQRSKRINSGKLFWYIRSKSYVPIPELRRRFEITPDEMGTIQDNGQKVYIGLPQDVADVVANLRRQQKIGLECSVDFTMPVVIGVYPLNR